MGALHPPPHTLPHTLCPHFRTPYLGGVSSCRWLPEPLESAALVCSRNWPSSESGGRGGRRGLRTKRVEHYLRKIRELVEIAYFSERTA